jgi:3-oxoacyl-[acyl-carrier protein] reductase
MSEGSRIITVSTSVAHNSAVLPPYVLYNATKGAIEQMTTVLSKSLGKKGILVNCIAPGPTSTELFMRGKPEQLINLIKGQSPMNRLATPEEIADVMYFLSSDLSRWVSGQILMVNGASVPSN